MASNQYPSRLRRSRSGLCTLLLSLVSSTALLPRAVVASFQVGCGLLNIQQSSMARSSPSSTTALSAKKAAGGADITFVTNKRCPFAQKAWIALEASDCPYEMREISLYGAGGKPDWFWKLNPAGTVPVVSVKDGAVFADSELILDAVGDGSISNNGGGILTPSDELSAEQKSHVDEWRKYISKKLIPTGKSAVLGGSVPKLREVLKEMDGMVAGPYLVGDKMTLADCAAFPFLWRINNEFGLDGEEKLSSWLEQCMSTEEVKRTIPTQGWWWWW